MKVEAIRSDKIYRKIINSLKENRNDIYRFELMKPFESKWQMVGVPLKSQVENDFDVISMSSMGGGYIPSEMDERNISEVDKISDDCFWKSCEDSITNALKAFKEHGINLPVENYIFTILLNNPNNPMSKMTGDYCGEGGIPGYILGTIIPNEVSLNLYGDEIISIRGIEPVGMPYCAGYVCGYELIKYYLQKSGKNIYEATIMNTEDILRETEEFWK